MSAWQEIRSAKRRAASMGHGLPWRPEYDAHPLAACIYNHSNCIDAELSNSRPDATAMLCWVLAMARKVNAYCAAARIAGDHAAEYWLDWFLHRVDAACDVDLVPA